MVISEVNGPQNPRDPRDLSAPLSAADKLKINHLAADIIGKPIDEAEAMIKDAGFTSRTLMLDGELGMGTADIRYDRLDLSVKGGKVTGVSGRSLYREGDTVITAEDTARNLPKPKKGYVWDLTLVLESLPPQFEFKLKKYEAPDTVDAPVEPIRCWGLEPGWPGKPNHGGTGAHDRQAGERTYVQQGAPLPNAPKGHRWEPTGEVISTMITLQEYELVREAPPKPTLPKGYDGSAVIPGEAPAGAHGANIHGQPRIEGDHLVLTAQTGGGFVADHEFGVYWDELFLESFPVQVNLHLVDHTEDPAEALLYRDLRIDLSFLKKSYAQAYGSGGGQINMNINGERVEYCF